MAHIQGSVISYIPYIGKLFVYKAPKDPELKKIFEELKGGWSLPSCIF